MRYSNETKKKTNGVVYTPSEMADYVAGLMAKYKRHNDNNDITILDPAVGEGELLISMIKAVRENSKKISIVGYETDEAVGRATEERLKRLFPDVSVTIRIQDFLEAVDNGSVETFDYIIANPPYIRTQILGSNRAQAIAEKLSLTGRVDIYYAFLVYTKEVLKDDGIAGYITSNKFMTIKAGNSVRKFMLDNYCMHHVTDLGDTKLFSAAVLPCIMIFSKGETTSGESVSFSSVYQHMQATESAIPIESIFEKIDTDGYGKLSDGRIFKFQSGTMNYNDSSLWTIASKESVKWLAKVEENTWIHFSNIGKIRVGIKTTADNVFIGDNWEGEDAEIELLRPLITHRNAGQIIPNKESQWKVLYTHTTTGGKRVAYNLEEYPKAKRYLEKHYSQLSGRDYVRKAKRNWYEIWVPQNPESWNHKKIVFRDISEKPEFWYDESGAIVNGDCYWIDINPGTLEEVVYLALAVANSAFIERYYDLKYNTKLYSGKRRFQTQYVESFPIPYYDSDLAKQAIELVKKIIAIGDAEESYSYKQDLDRIVDKLFS